MKNKKLFILFIIISVSVTIVLLMNFTYLWFLESDNVEAKPTVISTAPALLSLEIRPMGDSSYMGQTGKDADMDSPFRKHFNLMLECNGGEVNNVRIRINDLAIKMWDYNPAQGSENIQVLTEEEIQDNFTFRFFYFGRTYIPDQNGFLYYLDGSLITYLIVEKGEVMDGMLTLIYLGEESYIKWQAQQYESYDEFAYCTPDYMGATFSFDIEFLLGEAVINISEQISFEISDEDFVPMTGDTIASTYIYTEGKQIMSNVNKTLKASIFNVARVRNGEIYYLTTQEIENNFTLRITCNEKEYMPSQETLTDNYFYSEESQITEWFTIQSDHLYNLEISVIGQDETDYVSMLDDPLYVPTSFAYGEEEYAEDIFIYQIRIQMVDTPQ